ncbi:hypothetical protein SDC9_204612 [bioreactor metagenome]|uniref:Uncharacterized protein n=1 Tax=bioreactor metagenome TaxID=1076179 RepID=A0A645J2I2_9ZZZZ
MADVVAMPEPHSAPKNMHARMVTQPRLPVTKPISADAKSTIRLAMPPVDIRAPASMKKGMAITVNENMPE